MTYKSAQTKSASKDEEIEHQTNLGKTRMAALIVGLWFIVSLAASRFDIFESGSNPPIALAVAVFAPIIIFGALYSSSGRFAETVGSWSLSFLTWAQSVRVIGFAFIAYFAVGLLPGIFALPAGLGDIFAGVTAPLVALYVVRRNPLRKSLYAAWTVYGMIDLMLAISLGVISSAAFTYVFNFQPTTNPSIAELPLSLIPTFVVPLLFILEILALLRIRRTGEIN